MELLLPPLYKMQEQLDHRIEKEKGLEGKETFEQKVLALLVEVGELANETRCFKFWSSKSASSKEIILEEFADGLHFILSLGLNLPFEVPKQFSIVELQHKDLVQGFLQVFEDIDALKKDRNDVNNYIRLLEDYLVIGCILNFTAEEIEMAYYTKNGVNHTRQDQGY